MDHKEELEKLNKSTLEKFHEYAKQKEHLGEEHQEKLKQAKDEWQASWAKLMEALMVLERIEI